MRSSRGFYWHWILCCFGLAGMGWPVRSATTGTEPMPIADPIADYLAMDVPDRKANAAPMMILKRVTVDLDGNHQPEVFVGTWYRRSGPNTWLWAAYKPVSGAYRRITPANADVLIDFNGIYVGPIPALHREGMVQGYSLELDNQDRDQSNLLSDVTYYYIEGDQLVEQGSGPLDRDDPEQRKTYEFFFGPHRQVRDVPRIESFSVGELIRLGYRLSPR